MQLIIVASAKVYQQKSDSYCLAVFLERIVNQYIIYYRVKYDILQRKT